MKFKFLSIFLILLTTSSCSSSVQTYDSTNDCLNAFQLDIAEDATIIDKFYIVGHAYGSHQSNNPALSYKLIDFLKTQEKNEYSLILTGDFIRKSSLENMYILREQLNLYFKEYYFSIGNHDIDYGKSDSFYKVFESDLEIVNYKNIDLIIANFSTFNWEPNSQDKEKINEYLKKSKSEYVILFSHQIFWEEMVKNPIKKNADDLLETSLSQNSLDWLERAQKKLIVISGDYGLHEYNTYCEHNIKTNTLFIANGLYDRQEDTVLELIITDSNFKLSEKNISN
tara:strand:+ start:2822 stop:3670 length:849 start_codon:yes stop_codon:yes gene_type:complete